jgi:hypothetical protein
MKPFRPKFTDKTYSEHNCDLRNTLKFKNIVQNTHKKVSNYDLTWLLSTLKPTVLSIMLM